MQKGEEIMENFLGDLVNIGDASRLRKVLSADPNTPIFQRILMVLLQKVVVKL